ncbi:MAG: cohesin domain-containing protein [Anaerolineales bacterium]|nr:MAG: cohesin domain-containing protein [Anaerolineales bacterium]
MKSKRLFQIFVLVTLLFSSLGGGQTAYASSPAAPPQDPIVINRNLDIWDATYVGFVTAGIHEKWHFDFTQTENFVVTVTPIASDFVPLLTLLDSSDNVLATGSGSLTSSQPAGSYSLTVQPQSGGGFYILTIRRVVSTQPSVSTDVSPDSVNAGETATATVSLNNVPAEGYTSTEFTCTYDPSLVQISNIVATNLFGGDPAVAINDPQNGTFIVAIAGTNGARAYLSGPAFTFTVTALQGGQATILCTARVSTGNNTLTDLPATGDTLSISGTSATPTPTGSPASTPTPDGSATSTPDGSPQPTATNTAPAESPTPTLETPVETPTPTFTFTPESSPTPTFTFTPESSPTPTFTFTPESSPTPENSPTPTTSPDGTLTGQVTAGKPVTIFLYSGNVLVTSVSANPDGTFSITVPAGNYSVVAMANGFLSAQGSANILPGSTTTKPTIALLAGDLDGNNVIDQFDALTIGMSYNTATPSAADLNNDSIINVLDLELLAQNYRDTGPTAWE